MADSSSSSSSEETPSETVAALFPIFLVAILSCFLFPITLYKIGRRFGLFSLIAGEEEDTKTKRRRRRRRRKRDDDKDEDKDDGKKNDNISQDIQIKAKDSLWAKSFEQSVHQSRQSMKRQMFFSG